jgi:hypothetical protein
MKKLIAIIIGLYTTISVFGQGIHFSQYYNNAALLNPSYTALLPEEDYRIGVQYRNQYQNITVPYNTFSAYADFGYGRAKNENGWWGFGGGFWQDNAGDGKLKLTKGQVKYV